EARGVPAACRMDQRVLEAAVELVAEHGADRRGVETRTLVGLIATGPDRGRAELGARARLWRLGDRLDMDRGARVAVPRDPGQKTAHRDRTGKERTGAAERRRVEVAHRQILVSWGLRGRSRQPAISGRHRWAALPGRDPRAPFRSREVKEGAAAPG